MSQVIANASGDEGLRELLGGPRERPTSLPRIGEMLIERGLIEPDDLATALEIQQSTGRRMGEVLVEMGALRSVDLTKILAERLGYPFVDLDNRPIDFMLVSLVPEDVARRYRALPLARHEGQLVVAMANPENVFALDDLRVLTQSTVIALMADRDQLLDAIGRAYSRNDVEESVDDAAGDFDDDLPDLGLRVEAEDAPIVRLVNALLEQAVEERASDIHVEPLSDRVRIRFRVDGVLHDASETPLSVLRPLVSRIKVLSSIDITRRRIPQDGRFSTSINGRSVDVRVATLPTSNGEAVVLRLLDQMRTVLDLGALGYRGSELERYEKAFRAPQGAVIVSGPTGSGKTSTLYATLAAINAPGTSIISVEDPVEYHLDGVKQIQVDTKSGLSFASALRSILRADPDVVLVGEIRDSETAKIAAEAAITGHLVFSTLHTTRAATVPMRLVDMGVEPYLVASSLTCVVAQRLVRTLCEHCAAADDTDLPLLRQLGCSDELLEGANVRRAVGCTACRGTGYRGRSGVAEIMAVTEDISRLVLGGASSQEIERQAIADGMDTLRMNGLRRVLSGELTVEEVLRVIAG